MAARYSAELKDQVVREIKEVGSITAVANKHGINPKTVHHWIKASKAGDNMKDSNKLNPFINS